MAQSAACIGCASSRSIVFERLSRRPSARKARTSAGRRQGADHVERDPAEELGVGGRARGLDAEGPELGVDLAVDDVGGGDLGDRRRSARSGRGRGPPRPGRCRRRRPRCRRAGGPGPTPVFETSATSVVPDAEVAERGDVGLGAVGEPGDDREPAGRARTFEVAIREAGSRSPGPRAAPGRAGRRRRSRRG